MTDGSVVLDAFTSVRSVKLDNDKFTLQGAYYDAIGVIREDEGICEVEMDVKFTRLSKVVLGFVLVLSTLPIVAQNLTLNGDSDPSWLKRVGAVLTGYLMTAVIVGLLHATKKEFRELIERKLKLNPVANNR